MKLLSKNKHLINRSVSAVLVGAFLAAALCVARDFDRFGNAKVYATTAQDIKDQAEQDLQDVNEQITSLEGEHQYVSNKIAKTAAELDRLIDDQKKLQEEIKVKQQEVEETNAALAAARESEACQYESMKLRIQFMYENNLDDSLWSMIFESKGLTDLLTRVEYISDVYKADRELMDAYEKSVQEVEDKTEQLAQEMEELLSLQDVYEEKQSVLEDKLASLNDQKDQFAKQIASAKEQADSYKETIRIQGEIIRQQEAAAAAAAAAEEERRRRQEEERRRREEEERRRQEEEEQRRQESLANAGNGNTSSTNGNSSGNTSGGSTSSEGGSSIGSTVIDPNTYEGGGTGESGLGSAAYLRDPNADPEFKTDISGSELVGYAMQFVGNPYVWGGNSLTKGCDCSGFVHLIYEHYGISTPRYSQSFKTWGEPVAYENIKAGDVVVYPGHVAIYIGNGCIVEAQSTRAGITSYRSVNCHTITAIRRGL